MQDVMPPTDTAFQSDVHSIRDIPVPQGRRAPVMQRPERLDGKPRGMSLWMRILLVVIAAILAGAIFVSFFPSATITIYPRQASLTLPATIPAQLDAPVGVLPFELVAATERSQRTLSATGSAPANVRAQGTITIYNSYSSASQPLIANTRFAAPDGDIYRIHSNVTVPGMKNGTPGSVQATVYADQPGTNYNRVSTKFTIPGFSGKPQFTKIYAQADAITGGFSGVRPIVSQSDIQKAQADLKQELSGKLSTSSPIQVPTGSTPVVGTFALQFGDPVVTDAGNGQAIMTQTATATEAVVRLTDVADALAKLQVQGYTSAAINFSDPSTIGLSLLPGAVYTAQTTTLSISVTGTSSLAWQFDPSQIQQALAGQQKSAFDTTIASFAPAITKANASLIPFWSMSFPKDAAKITVKVGTGN